MYYIMSYHVMLINKDVIFPAPDSEAAEEETRNLSSAETGDAIQTEAVRAKSLGDKMREKSWFGKKCVKIFRVFSNTFAMTFLAEWGDR